jgi:hypothetical protein
VIGGRVSAEINLIVNHVHSRQEGIRTESFPVPSASSLPHAHIKQPCF